MVFTFRVLIFDLKTKKKKKIVPAVKIKLGFLIVLFIYLLNELKAWYLCLLKVSYYQIEIICLSFFF